MFPNTTLPQRATLSTPESQKILSLIRHLSRMGDPDVFMITLRLIAYALNLLAHI